MGLTEPKKVIRVLVVDDSPLVRQILVSMFDSDPGFVVVGEAADGVDGARQAIRLRPDVITMDIRMPRLDGLGAIEQIMGAAPTPIVVVTSQEKTVRIRHSRIKRRVNGWRQGRGKNRQVDGNETDHQPTPGPQWKWRASQSGV